MWRETRETIARLLSFEEDIQVVGMAADGQEAMAMTRRLLPDCVLMDINMPGLDGLTATQLISVEAPGTVIIMISCKGSRSGLRKRCWQGQDYLVKLSSAMTWSTRSSGPTPWSSAAAPPPSSNRPRAGC